ncbi:hypothetical protein [Peribacillus sp. SCS-155]|uniref:hypothetical protein n=1 Tax=Peribacillus sedimenti TaxID=3115297 RepID=UPI003905E2FA
MKILYALVIIIVVISIVLTLSIMGESDKNYRSSTKRNTVNLTLIYAVIITLSLLVLGVYISVV